MNLQARKCAPFPDSFARSALMSSRILAPVRRWRSLAWERPMKTAQQAVTAIVGDKPWNEARQVVAAPAPSRAPAVAQKVEMRASPAVAPLNAAVSSGSLQLTGLVRRVRFQSPETGYTVMQFQLDESPGSRKQVLTVVGHLAKVRLSSVQGFGSAWRPLLARSMCGAGLAQQSTFGPPTYASTTR